MGLRSGGYSGVPVARQRHAAPGRATAAWHRPAPGTRFPAWLALLNPITLLVLFLGFRRIAPAAISDRLEGAGFNVAYLAFFALTTVTIS